ncbi:MAG: MarR family transcriptional regulator [Lachnospiraceae bacterium]|nr:MarR family transcriptional regulator [Lachnospiraceae bacterium]
MDRFERFTISIFNISHYWNRIAAEEMKKHDLKGTYALYLLTLYSAQEENERITAARLAELCQRDKADVSRAVSMLQKRGIIEPYGANRYRVPLILTPQGRELGSHLRQRASLALQTAGQGISEEMRSNMYRCLDIIARNMRSISEEGL